MPTPIGVYEDPAYTERIDAQLAGQRAVAQFGATTQALDQRSMQRYGARALSDFTAGAQALDQAGAETDQALAYGHTAMSNFADQLPGATAEGTQLGQMTGSALQNFDAQTAYADGSYADGELVGGQDEGGVSDGLEGLATDETPPDMSAPLPAPGSPGMPMPTQGGATTVGSGADESGSLQQNGAYYRDPNFDQNVQRYGKQVEQLLPGAGRFAVAQAREETGNGQLFSTPFNFGNVNNTDSNPKGGGGFSNPEAAAQAWVKFITNDGGQTRYQDFIDKARQGSDVPTLASSIKAAGYATDANYVKNISDNDRGDTLDSPANGRVATATTEALKAGADPLDLESARARLGEKAFIGLCETFVEQAETGHAGIHASATAAWQDAVKNDRAHAGLAGVQPGDEVHFDNPDDANDYGHVGFYAGNGKFISATNEGIRQYDVGQWEKITGQNLRGWVAGPDHDAKKSGEQASNSTPILGGIGNAFSALGSMVSPVANGAVNGLHGLLYGGPLTQDRLDQAARDAKPTGYSTDPFADLVNSGHNATDPMAWGDYISGHLLDSATQALNYGKHFEDTGLGKTPLVGGLIEQSFNPVNALLMLGTGGLGEAGEAAGLLAKLGPEALTAAKVAADSEDLGRLGELVGTRVNPEMASKLKQVLEGGLHPLQTLSPGAAGGARGAAWTGIGAEAASEQPGATPESALTQGLLMGAGGELLPAVIRQVLGNKSGRKLMEAMGTVNDRDAKEVAQDVSATVASNLGNPDVAPAIAEALMHSRDERLGVTVRPEDMTSYTAMGGEQVQMHAPTKERIPGTPVTAADLPDTLYHVTTNAPTVDASGRLLANPPAGGNAGLGRGNTLEHQGVSFTSDKNVAAQLQTDALRAGEVTRGGPARTADGTAEGAAPNGETLEAMLRRYAREDERTTGLPQGALDPAVDQVKGTYGQDAFTPGHYQSKLDTANSRLEALRSYLGARAGAARKALGVAYGEPNDTVKRLQDPMFMERGERYAGVTPETVKTLAVNSADLPKEPLITRGPVGDHLDEVRVYGDVPIGEKKGPGWLTHAEIQAMAPDEARAYLEGRGAPPMAGAAPSPQRDLLAKVLDAQGTDELNGAFKRLGDNIGDPGAAVEDISGVLGAAAKRSGQVDALDKQPVTEDNLMQLWKAFHDLQAGGFQKEAKAGNLDQAEQILNTSTSSLRRPREAGGSGPVGERPTVNPKQLGPLAQQLATFVDKGTSIEISRAFASHASQTEKQSTILDALTRAAKRAQTDIDWSAFQGPVEKQMGHISLALQELKDSDFWKTQANQRAAKAAAEQARKRTKADIALKAPEGSSPGDLRSRLADAYNALPAVHEPEVSTGDFQRTQAGGAVVRGEGVDDQRRLASYTPPEKLGAKELAAAVGWEPPSNLVKTKEPGESALMDLVGHMQDVNIKRETPGGLKPVGEDLTLGRRIEPNQPGAGVGQQVQGVLGRGPEIGGAPTLGEAAGLARAGAGLSTEGLPAAMGRAGARLTDDAEGMQAHTNELVPQVGAPGEGRSGIVASPAGAEVSLADGSSFQDRYEQALAEHAAAKKAFANPGGEGTEFARLQAADTAHQGLIDEARKAWDDGTATPLQEKLAKAAVESEKPNALIRFDPQDKGFIQTAADKAPWDVKDHIFHNTMAIGGATVGAYHGATENDDDSITTKAAKAALYGFGGLVTGGHVIGGGGLINSRERALGVGARAVDTYVNNLLSSGTLLVKGMNDSTQIALGPVTKALAASFGGRISSAPAEMINGYRNGMMGAWVGLQKFGETMHPDWRSKGLDLDQDIPEKDASRLFHLAVRTAAGDEAAKDELAKLVAPNKAMSGIGQYASTLFTRTIEGVTQMAREILTAQEVGSFKAARAHGFGAEQLGATGDEAAKLERGLISPQDIAAIKDRVNRALLVGQPKGAVAGTMYGLTTVLNHKGALDPAGRLLVPFRLIPSNMLGQVAESIPLVGILEMASRKAPVSEIAARQLLSTAVILPSMMAFGNDMQGYGPVEPNAHRTWLEQGNVPWSVKVGDKWVQMRQLPAFMQGPMRVLGAYKDHRDWGGSSTLGPEIQAELTSSLEDHEFFPKWLHVLDGMTDPNQAPAAERFVAEQAGSVVPTAVGQVATATRSFAPETAPKGATFGELVKKAIAARLPGNSFMGTSTEPKLGPAGEQLPNPSEGWNAFLGSYKPHDTHLDVVSDLLGKANVALPNPPNKLSIGGGTPDAPNSVPLNEAERRQFQQLQGQALARMLQPHADGFGQMPPLRQEALIAALKQSAQEVATAQVLRGMFGSGQFRQRMTEANQSAHQLYMQGRLGAESPEDTVTLS